MDNILIKYLSERVEKEKDETQREPGPVITVSRQYGCYASEIARLLAEHLNMVVKEKKQDYQWKWIAKEVLDEASQHLDSDPAHIAHIFAANERSFMEDMAKAFSVKKYARDPQIKKLISKIVRQYAEQGHVVIVGRAGCVLAKHIKKSLHVRLIAPDSYRVKQIMERFDFDKKDAKKHIEKLDENRNTFMRFFNGDKPEAELFDLILNRDTLSNEEIVQTIMRCAELRDMV